MGWPDAMWLKKQLMGSGNQEITTNTVVTITQIPNNQYGFYIKLVDIDGETPLKDVVLNGVSDPSTELRTNANGELKFYSSKATHNVTWTNLPSHLDNSMFPSKLQGYINDLTSTVVELDVSSFYGYEITFKNHSGGAFANMPVYSTIGGGTVFKTTDRDSKIKFYSSTDSSMTIFVKDVSSAGYYYKYQTVQSPTKGNVANIEIKCDDVLYTGNPTVGSTITFKGKSWIVAHKNGNNIYVSDSVIESMTTFGNNTTYSGSTLASVASTFQNSLSLTSNEQALIPNTSVNGVSSKIFVASYEQMNGGWSYFNSDTRRVCKYKGSAQVYWTSSPYSGSTVWCVSTDGSLSSSFPGNSFGFRPSVCLPA